VKMRLLLGMAVAVATAWSGGQSRADQYAYGIGDDNRIYQVVVSPTLNSPVGGRVDNSWSTGLNGNWDSNSLALDTNQNRLIFRSPENGGSLYAFDLTNPTDGGASVITGTEDLPAPSASAAFYGGSYWYVENNSNNLVRVDFNANGTYKGVDEMVLNPDDLDASYGFGDIVITSTGLLYGSTGTKFFSVQLGSDSNEPESPFRIVNSNGGNLQLTLGLNGELYGYQHDNSNPNSTDKGWFSINTTDEFGKRTFLGYTTDSSSFRDLADTTVATPEPSTLAICALGGLAMAWRLRRRAVA